MITDMILHKYMRHLRYIDQGSIVHLDAVELALRLALEELEASIPSTPSMASTPPTELATLQAELERLQTAADAEVADLRKQLAELDTDNAALIRRNKELTDAINRARQDAALDNTAAIINSQLNRRNTELAAQIVTLQAELAAAHPNGDAPSTISNQQSPISNSMWSDPDMLHLLDDEAKDWWIGVAADRHTWRTVPKPVQLRMVRHILSFGPETGAMKMSDFDAIKPDWMPGSGSHTKTLNLSWSQLNDWSVEL